MTARESPQAAFERRTRELTFSLYACLAAQAFLIALGVWMVGWGGPTMVAPGVFNILLNLATGALNCWNLKTGRAAVLARALTPELDDPCPSTKKSPT